MKRVYPDKAYCIGCHLCELACITAHSKSKDLIVAYREERTADGLSPCKRVFEKGDTCVAISCRHCDEPSCVAACISGGLHKDPETIPWGQRVRHPDAMSLIHADDVIERLEAVLQHAAAPPPDKDA